VPTPSAASTSSTPGSRAPPTWASTGGGEWRARGKLILSWGWGGRDVDESGVRAGYYGIGPICRVRRAITSLRPFKNRRCWKY
jgi:hypothetical protein